MNLHTSNMLSPVALLLSIWRNRRIILQMTHRDVVGRYKGSIMGLGWSFFNPVLMLTVYTFVFSVVFKARWGIDAEESKTDFALVLFVGLIVHGMLAEVLNRSPGLVLGHVNYVKKVVFPLEILPVVIMGAALFHAFVSVAVFLVAFVLLHGYLNWSVIITPLVILPLLFVALGFSWILASLGVYLRDVGHIIGVITTVLLFLSPVFYPLSALPEKYQSFLFLNPLTFIIEEARLVLIQGQMPNWTGLALYLGISVLIAWLGFWWFQKTRKGFADVL